jgi:hypothetical protein
MSKQPDYKLLRFAEELFKDSDILEARKYDPMTYGGAEEIQKVASTEGSLLADSHYPYAVIADIQELRSFAEGQSVRWWSKLLHREQYEDRFPEAKRIFTARFIHAYMERLKQLKPHQDSAVIEIKNHHLITDGILYTIEFLAQPA